MNLEKKKELAKKVLKIGKDRIVFLEPRLKEIKEAITKQDIRDLQKEGAIIIKEIKGRKKTKRKKRRARSVGNVRKKPNTRKRNYISLVRKLREYTSELKKQGKLSKEEIARIRKKIKNKDFKSKSHLKEYIKELKK